MEYSMKISLEIPFDSAVALTRQVLQENSFGIITEIDLKKKLKEKLDVEYPNYLILGACLPESAYRAVQEERDVGLLLPCNVIVYEKDGQSIVAAINPEVAMSFIPNSRLKEIAGNITQKLKKVINSIKEKEVENGAKT